jgi:pSer/pThr/pTyr-binding forkhead associated (FHA) protein
MALTLTVRSGTASAPSLTLDLPKILLGRGKGSDLVLPDPSVSHVHASIRQRGSEYIVLDEGSTNGTHVGPVRLSEGTPRVLKSGDMVRLGRVWVEVTIEQAVPSPDRKNLTKEIALCLIEGGFLAEGEQVPYPKITVVAGNDQGRTLALDEFHVPYVIGRSHKCDLPLDDEDTSRRHVEVTRRGVTVWVRDLGSKNGSTLAGTPLSDEPVGWQPKTTLRLGHTEIVLEDPMLDTLAELEHAADEVVDESVDPPEPAGAKKKPAGAEPARERSRAAKVAEVPRRRSEPPAARAGTRWGAVDAFILLLAILVLAASVVGLIWLL